MMSCHFFVFFFFKQKTAYEMRISDWSSDVCSSDLQYGPGWPALVVDLADPVHEGNDVGNFLVLHVQIGHQPPMLLLVVELGGEIGRASCRERVCQYV